jgi:hypothetical protein
MFNPYSESELRKALNSGQEVFFLMPIEREEIESKDVSRVEDFLKVCTKIGEPLKQKCGLSVSGYDDTSEELFEIKEVRKFVEKLFKRNPYLMYYMDTRVGYDEWLLSSWADEVVAIRGNEHLGRNVFEIWEEYGANPPQFQVKCTFKNEKFVNMLDGLRKHGKKIGDSEGANEIAAKLDKHFNSRI